MIILDSNPKQPDANAGRFLSLIRNPQVRKPTQEAQPTENNYTPENVSKQVALANINTNRVSYSYNKEIDMVVVSVHDENSDEVVRQIPTKDFIDMKIALKDHIGKILDIKV